MSMRSAINGLLVLIMLALLAGCGNYFIQGPDIPKDDDKKTKDCISVGSSDATLPADGGISIHSATLISPGGTVSDSLSRTGDMDMFRVDNVGGGTLVTAELSGPTSADFDLYIRQSSPPTTGAYDDRGYTSTSSEHVEVTASSTGHIYIMVHSYRGSGNYTLRTEGQGGLPPTPEPLPPPPDTEQDDHGDDANHATSLQPGAVLMGNIDVPGDVDFFEIEVTPGCSYTLRTTLDTLEDSVLTAYVRRGLLGTLEQVAENDDSHNSLASELRWTLVSAESLIVRARAFSTSQTGRYHIALQRSCPGPHPSMGIAYKVNVTAVSNISTAPGGALSIIISDMVGNVVYQTLDHGDALSVNVLLPGPGLFTASAAAIAEEYCMGMGTDSERFLVDETNPVAEISLDASQPCIPPPESFR